MIKELFIISLYASPVILFFAALSPLLRKRFGSRCMYFIWLFIAVRLIIPFRISFPAPVENRLPDVSDVVTYVENRAISNAPIAASDVAAPVVHKRAISTRDLLPFIYIAPAAAILAFRLISYAVFIISLRPGLEEKESYRTLRVFSSPRVASPMLIGFFFPKVIMPHVSYSTSEMQMILKHEYTHYKRRDIWYKLLLSIALALHFFNPFIYIMCYLANRDLELSCDEIVVKDTDISFRKDYSNAILKSIKVRNGKK